MRAVVALLIALAASAAAPTTNDPEAERAAGDLGRDLERAIADVGWTGDRWSVLVVSLDGGDTLYAHRPDEALTPASNLKLFTTAAALHHLGPDYRYATYLTAVGPLRQGTIEGDLLVYGTGDPTFSGRFHETKQAVWEALADSLHQLGVRRIAGDLVGDASYFEGPGFGRGWETSYVTHTYAASASALSFNDNVVTLRVRPAAEPGSPARIQLVPGGGVQMRNEVQTVQSGRSWVEVEKAGYDAPIVVRGQIARGHSGLWRAVPVVDPARFAVSVLEEILASRGIQVAGGIRSVHDASSSPVTGQRVFAPSLEEEPPVQVLAVHRSPPLQEILNVINQRSHNLYAESVLRTVGRVATGHGSVEGGTAAVSELLKAAGVEAGAVVMDDGSGLSSLDRASAGSIVKLLAYMAASPHWEAYRESLPEAATSRGLRRMQQTPAAGNLRAKTGTIDRVSALSGYVRARNGELLAFSIISNNVPSTWKAKRVEDRIGARLASYDRPAPARRAERLAQTPEPADTARRATAASTEAAPPRAAAPRADAAAANGDAARAEAEAAPVTYTVKAGDTLDAIARRHGISVRALEEANPGLNPRRLQIGQRSAAGA